MKPLNRRLLIEVIEEEPQQGAFFVPARVIACAEDCANDLTGKTVIIHAFGKEEVTVKGKKYTFIGENHLICVE